MNTQASHSICSAGGRFSTPLDVGSLEKAGLRVTERSFDPAESVFMRGDPADRLYLLHGGMVRLYKPYGYFGEATVALLKDRGGFGEFDLFGRDSQSSSAETLTACRVATVRKGDFRLAIQRRPELALELFSLFSERLRHSEQAMEVLLYREVSARLTSLLPALARRFFADYEDGVEAIIPLSHSEIAGMTASTREAVSKALKSLESEGLIELGKRRVTVGDLRALEERAASPPR